MYILLVLVRNELMMLEVLHCIQCRSCGLRYVAGTSEIISGQTAPFQFWLTSMTLSILSFWRGKGKIKKLCWLLCHGVNLCVWMSALRGAEITGNSLLLQLQSSYQPYHRAYSQKCVHMSVQMCIDASAPSAAWVRSRGSSACISILVMPYFIPWKKLKTSVSSIIGQGIFTDRTRRS